MMFGTAMVEVVVLVAVLASASAFGFWRLRTDGRVRDTSAAPPPAAPPPPGHATAGHAASPAKHASAGHPAATAPLAKPAVSPNEIGRALGTRATLVQFSSAFCAPCRATRQVLGQVADAVPGVVHVEVDAESHLDLVRRLDIRRTPTTLVLDEAGHEVRRATGVPRNDEVLAVVGEAVA